MSTGAKYSLYPEQKDLSNSVLNGLVTHKNVFMQLPTGGGKSLGVDTPVLMYDGTIKKVQDIQVGDKLMGPDSEVRNVLQTTTGEEEMFDIIPIKGDTWSCNRSHILSLVLSGQRPVKIKDQYCQPNQVVNVHLEDYMESSITFKHRAKQYRVGVKFPDTDTELRIDPYLLGVWLGDGNAANTGFTTGDKEMEDYLKEYAKSNNLICSVAPNTENSVRVFINSGIGRHENPLLELFRSYDLINNKHVPFDYLVSSTEDRLQLLAGLLDTDGYMNNNYFDIVQKNSQISNSILFLARSLGLAAYSSKKEVTLDYGFTGTYNRIKISGHVDKIPVRLQKRKPKLRKQKKDVLRTGFSVKSKGIGKYYGVVIDGDRRFMLGDFTVVHNTIIFNDIIRRCHKKGYRTLLLAHREELIVQAYKKLHSSYGIHSGIIKSGYPQNNALPCQIASVQSLVNRKDNIPKNIKLVITDEAHHATASTYRQIYSWYPEAYNLGVSATPWRLNGEGFDDIFKEMYCGPSIREMEKLGWIVPAVIKVCKVTQEEMSHVKMYRGDYQQKGLFKLMAEEQKMVNAIHNYKVFGQGKQCMCFAVNVEHSRQIAALYNKHGIKAIHVDANSRNRKHAIEGFEKKRYQVFVNVGIATEGTDIPGVEVIQLLRPTKSLSLFLQMVGRGCRSAPGKKSYLLLDHANCVLDHGVPNKDRKWTLSSRPKRKTEARENYFKIRKDGKDVIVSALDIPITTEGIDLVPYEPAENDRLDEFYKFLAVANKRGFKTGWAYYRFRDKMIKSQGRYPTDSELHFIAKKLGYQAGWYYHQVNQRRDWIQKNA